MGWRMHSHRLVMGAVVLAGLVMIVGYLLSGVPSSFLLGGALVQTSDVTTIVVDAGHGGYDSGSISASGVLEKDVTLEVALLVGERLQEAGYAVVYTRTGDEVSWPSDNSADLAARVETAIEAEADYYLSIHLNASVVGDGVRGFEIYADPDDAEMWAMASAVEEQLAALDFSEDRGVKDAWDSQLYVICHNPIPSLLVEMGFISDSLDIDYILSHPHLLADAITQGIIDSLEAE